MDVKFCDKCENMLYLYKEEDSEKLLYKCKACGNTDQSPEEITKVFTNMVGHIDKTEVINRNKYITHDVTLPSIRGNTNITCKNKLCDTEDVDIKYIKYDEINMKYMYICNHCGCKWKNNL